MNTPKVYQSPAASQATNLEGSESRFSITKILEDLLERLRPGLATPSEQLTRAREQIRQQTASNTVPPTPEPGKSS